MKQLGVGLDRFHTVDDHHDVRDHGGGRTKDHELAMSSSVRLLSLNCVSRGMETRLDEPTEMRRLLRLN